MVDIENSIDGDLFHLGDKTQEFAEVNFTAFFLFFFFAVSLPHAFCPTRADSLPYPGPK